MNQSANIVTLPSPSGTLSDRHVVDEFEVRYGARMRHKAWTSALGTAIGLAIIYWAFAVTGFGEAVGAQDTLQKVWEFFVRMDPQLEGDHLFEDSSTRGSLAFWFSRWPHWRDALIETVQMAFVATVLSTAFGFFLALLYARTTMPLVLVRWPVKRVLELVRTIPDLIMAIIFVAMFGLGPLAGLLTLTISGAATLGRYFGETLESIDKKPLNAMRAAGASHVQVIRYGVVPQVYPMLVSFTFLRFEVSIASATTLGIVGAGGIGVELTRAVNFNQFQSYLAILILIVILIILADLSSSYVRQKIAQTRFDT